ncbi:MAG: hypothetical protein RI900_1538, partial [Actinomycetota bacterium]
MPIRHILLLAPVVPLALFGAACSTESSAQGTSPATTVA